MVSLVAVVSISNLTVSLHHLNHMCFRLQDVIVQNIVVVLIIITTLKIRYFLAF